MKLEQLLLEEPFRSDPELAQLLREIHRLRGALGALSQNKFRRINPFVENLFDWKDKGAALFGEGKNISVYDSCSMAGDVEVGENTWIGPYTALDGNGGLKIGRNCSISSGVNIVTHDSVKHALSGGKMPYEYAPIEIGDFCYIGTNAVITKGVKIGHHCVVGAGAVVTRDLPDFSIALGVPARVAGRVKVVGEQIEFEYF